MTTTAMAERTCPVNVDLVSSLTEVLANQVHRWSDECQRFLDWQRQYVLVADATSEVRSLHETALRRLQAAGRILNSVTSDPLFLDRRAAELVKSRLAQLQESWALTHPAMTADEGEAVLAEHFELRRS